MKRIASQFLATLLVTVVCNAAFSQVVDRPIKIDEMLWLQLSDEPEHHMKEAESNLKAGNLSGASHNLRKAIVFLRIDAANCSGSCKDALDYAADDLLALTHRIEKGTPVRTIELERAFARAEHAIAENHCACAKESWIHKRNELVGYRMRAAGLAIERAAKWSGEELDAGARTTVDETRKIGASLVEGKDFVVDEIGKGLTSLGEGIARTGRRIER